MEGLKQYIRKHGRHFTEELAYIAVPIKWDLPSIEKVIKEEVWYNCWSATKGDMLYLVNMAYQLTGKNKRTCILFMLGTVGDYVERDTWFDAWVLDSEGINVKDYI